MEENTKTPKPVKVYNLIILDESGSMFSIYEQALTMMNETITGIRKSQEEHPTQKHYVSIVTFEGAGETAVKTRRDRVPVGKIEEMTREDYRPGGCTPLYDAMGSAITHLDKNIEEGDVALVTIITDGEENSSREYNRTSINSLVERMTENGWTFVYMGANQDSKRVARSMSITNALDFDATPSGAAKMSCTFQESRIRWCKRLDERFDDAFDKTIEGFFDEDEKKK